ncbi:hypothetical protein RJ640_026523 [Escallonia rubra]|uniref:AAA ATPase AAA+ lid domain-containing protein n=1 Tax=Escallonia rubra TaxID=112253 RepID=A0AA88UGV4_9ASTE|nr:hypothetical protein RJ640_026523 [Escallonia rubra]
MRGVPLAKGKTLICNALASITQGSVGADLANIVNEAVVLAARRVSSLSARSSSKTYDFGLAG